MEISMQLTSRCRVSVGDGSGEGEGEGVGDASWGRSYGLSGVVESAEQVGKCDLLLVMIVCEPQTS